MGNDTETSSVKSDSGCGPATLGLVAFVVSGVLAEFGALAFSPWLHPDQLAWIGAMLGGLSYLALFVIGALRLGRWPLRRAVPVGILVTLGEATAIFGVSSSMTGQSFALGGWFFELVAVLASSAALFFITVGLGQGRIISRARLFRITILPAALALAGALMFISGGWNRN